MWSPYFIYLPYFLFLFKTYIESIPIIIQNFPQQSLILDNIISYPLYNLILLPSYFVK